VRSLGGAAFFPAYRPRASALHAARAGVGAAFCAALALVFVVFDHPLVIAAGLAGVVIAGWCAGVAPELARSGRLGLAVAAFVLLVNPLVSTDGATVLVRGWSLLGHRFDVTLEAIGFGAVAGLRLLGLILACALFSAAVDPDDLLRSLRRLSYRSALTAALATRLVPVLARDAMRRAEAARCRVRPTPRMALARATLTGSLERAGEVAAALEVRGYGMSGRAEAPAATSARARRRARWLGHSRHDVRMCAAAAALALVGVTAAAAGLAPFAAYPRIEVPLGAREVALAATVPALAAAPFLGVAARLGVGRGGGGRGGDGDG